MTEKSRVYVDGMGDERVVPLRNQNTPLRRLAEFIGEHRDELGVIAVWIEPDDDGYDELHYGLSSEVQEELWGEVDDGHLVLRMTNSCT